MPSDRLFPLEGPSGHTKGTLREWDYDRGGSAYLIICECGEKTQRYWTLRDAKNEHARHILVNEFTWRGANTGELLDFLKGRPLDAISFWLRYVDQHPLGIKLYKRFNKITADDPREAVLTDHDGKPENNASASRPLGAKTET